METIAAKLRAFGVCEDLAKRVAEQFANRSCSEEVWERWVASVDDSDYGWPEWTEALLLLDARIAACASARPPALSQLVAYVGCVAEGSTAAGLISSLPEEVGAAFDTFGFADGD